MVSGRCLLHWIVSNINYFWKHYQIGRNYFWRKFALQNCFKCQLSFYAYYQICWIFSTRKSVYKFSKQNKKMISPHSSQKWNLNLIMSHISVGVQENFLLCILVLYFWTFLLSFPEHVFKDVISGRIFFSCRRDGKESSKN